MRTEDESEGMLSPYRVLDFTDERGLLCSKILADLGADVLQVEPPTGSSARCIGPFYQDQVHAERSLYWWCYAANKRGITLNTKTLDGQALLARLAVSANFAITAGTPSELEAQGLHHEHLMALNPELIVVSITPFGMDGPYANYQAPDIVGMGLGGFMYVTGDPDRAPLRVGVPHFYLHGSAAGAAGAMLAHAQRVLTGQGQHVNVSCQEAVTRALANSPQSYAVEQAVIKRQGSYRQMGTSMFMRITWPCKDGHVNFQLSGGSGSGPSVNRMVRWIAEEGLGDDYMESLDFTKLGYGTLTKEILDRVVPVVERFLMRYTKQKLFDEAVERRILLFPVATTQDIVANPQLKARDYFQTIDHPDIPTPIPMVGPFVRASATPIQRPHPAPKVGEHNQMIYVDELGLQKTDLVHLREAGVI